MAYSAKIIADSVSDKGDRVTTMEVTFPRLVLAEFNTHRMFSRNSASSRAIPVAKQLERITTDPFIPEYWGVNQKGMQADAQLEDTEREEATNIWLEARDSAVSHVQRLMSRNVHKQIANRLLEPFMWHTVIVTATEWSNFFALRANPMAQPEIRVIAEMMLELYRMNRPTPVPYGGWHLPLIQADEYDGAFELSKEARKISAARCARVSYLTHDGRRDLAADLELYERLVSGGHLSPLEHVAMAFEHNEHGVVFDGGRLLQYARVPVVSAWIGNFRGWKQLRKFVRNEQDFSQVEKK